MFSNPNLYTKRPFLPKFWQFGRFGGYLLHFCLFTERSIVVSTRGDEKRIERVAGVKSCTNKSFII